MMFSSPATVIQEDYWNPCNCFWVLPVIETFVLRGGKKRGKILAEMLQVCTVEDK